MGKKELKPKKWECTIIMALPKGAGKYFCTRFRGNGNVLTAFPALTPENACLFYLTQGTEETFSHAIEWEVERGSAI